MRQNGFAVIVAIVMSPFRLSVRGHCYMSATTLGFEWILCSDNKKPIFFPLSSCKLVAIVPAAASLPFHIPTAMATSSINYVQNNSNNGINAPASLCNLRLTVLYIQQFGNLNNVGL
jgi:hypothetical protein